MPLSATRGSGPTARLGARAVRAGPPPAACRPPHAEAAAVRPSQGAAPASRVGRHTVPGQKSTRDPHGISGQRPVVRTSRLLLLQDVVPRASPQTPVDGLHSALLQVALWAAACPPRHQPTVLCAPSSWAGTESRVLAPGAHPPAARPGVGIRDAPCQLLLLNSPKDQHGHTGADPGTAVPEGKVKVKVLFPFRKATKRENTDTLSRAQQHVRLAREEPSAVSQAATAVSHPVRGQPRVSRRRDPRRFSLPASRRIGRRAAPWRGPLPLRARQPDLCPPRL